MAYIKPKIHFVTFADSKYVKTRRRIIQEAQNNPSREFWNLQLNITCHYILLNNLYLSRNPDAHSV